MRISTALVPRLDRTSTKKRSPSCCPIPKAWLPQAWAAEGDALLLAGRPVETGKMGTLPNVPLLRLVYGFLAREGMRSDKMGRLRWRDVEPRTAHRDRPAATLRAAREPANPLRVHDLRATFITISLATGKTETWVIDRTGHTISAMVDRYRRKGRSWKLDELGPPAHPHPRACQGLPYGLPLKTRANVAELADAPDSGSGGVTPVRVQLPPFALEI